MEPTETNSTMGQGPFCNIENTESTRGNLRNLVVTHPKTMQTQKHNYSLPKTHQSHHVACNSVLSCYFLVLSMSIFLSCLSQAHSFPSNGNFMSDSRSSQRSQLDLLIDPIHQAENGDEELESKRVVAKSVFDMVLRTPSPSASFRCPPGTQTIFEGGRCIKKSTAPVALVDDAFLLDTLRGLAKEGVLLGGSKSRKPGGNQRRRPSGKPANRAPSPKPTPSLTTTVASTVDTLPTTMLMDISDSDMTVPGFAETTFVTVDKERPGESETPSSVEMKESFSPEVKINNDEKNTDFPVTTMHASVKDDNFMTTSSSESVPHQHENLTNKTSAEIGLLMPEIEDTPTLSPMADIRNSAEENSATIHNEWNTLHENNFTLNKNADSALQNEEHSTTEPNKKEISPLISSPTTTPTTFIESTSTVATTTLETTQQRISTENLTEAFEMEGETRDDDSLLEFSNTDDQIGTDQGDVTIGSLLPVSPVTSTTSDEQEPEKSVAVDITSYDGIDTNDQSEEEKVFNTSVESIKQQDIESTATRQDGEKSMTTGHMTADRLFIPLLRSTDSGRDDGQKETIRDGDDNPAFIVVNHSKLIETRDDTEPEETNWNNTSNVTTLMRETSLSLPSSDPQSAVAMAKPTRNATQVPTNPVNFSQQPPSQSDLTGNIQQKNEFGRTTEKSNIPGYHTIDFDYTPKHVPPTTYFKPVSPFQSGDTLLQFQVPIVTTEQHDGSNRFKKFLAFPSFSTPTRSGRIRFPYETTFNFPETPTSSSQNLKHTEQTEQKPFRFSPPDYSRRDSSNEGIDVGLSNQEWETIVPFQPVSRSTPTQTSILDYDRESTEYLESELDRRHQKTRSRNRLGSANSRHSFKLPTTTYSPYLAH